LAGCIALAAGMLVAAMTMNSPLYDGPLARALGGADLSWLLGFPVAGLTYAALTLILERRSSKDLVALQAGAE
jgi:purine-cytosine permease-like protein